MRAAAALAALLLFAAAPARADVILSAENLNASLKTLQRLRRDIEAAPAAQRPELVFQLGVAADALASLLTDELVAHGLQERQLLELAQKRTREMGVSIGWQVEKKRFFYDGEAFRTYLSLAPRGPNAAAAEFWQLETEFYQASGEDPDPRAILPALERKKAFLTKYPKFPLAPDVGVFIAIDYRDLYRHYAGKGDAGRAARYRKLARDQFARVAAAYPGHDQGKIAAEMLRRLEAERPAP